MYVCFLKSAADTMKLMLTDTTTDLENHNKIIRVCTEESFKEAILMGISKILPKFCSLCPQPAWVRLLPQLNDKTLICSARRWPSIPAFINNLGNVQVGAQSSWGGHCWRASCELPASARDHCQLSSAFK